MTKETIKKGTKVNISNNKRTVNSFFMNSLKKKFSATPEATVTTTNMVQSYRQLLATELSKTVVSFTCTSFKPLPGGPGVLTP